MAILWQAAVARCGLSSTAKSSPNRKNMRLSSACLRWVLCSSAATSKRRNANKPPLRSQPPAFALRQTSSQCSLIRGLWPSDLGYSQLRQHPLSTNDDWIFTSLPSLRSGVFIAMINSWKQKGNSGTRIRKELWISGLRIGSQCSASVALQKRFFLLVS